MLRRYWWLIPAALGVLFLIRFALLGIESRGAVPAGGGSRLADCPPTPNCVSSRAGDEPHRIEPLRFSDAPGEALARAASIVDAMAGSALVETAADYRRLEFRSPVFGFVDDLELLLAPEAGRIDIRSASRVGYSDLGVNRRRAESVRAAFESSGAQAAGDG